MHAYQTLPEWPYRKSLKEERGAVARRCPKGLMNKHVVNEEPTGGTRSLSYLASAREPASHTAPTPREVAAEGGNRSETGEPQQHPALSPPGGPARGDGRITCFQFPASALASKFHRSAEAWCSPNRAGGLWALF